MTGDSWWSGVVSGLQEDYPLIVALLMLYYCVTAYGLLNIVTGIFVEQTLNTSKTDAELLKDKTDESNQQVKTFLVELFGLMDRNRDGRVFFPEFEQAINEPEIQFGLGLIDLKVDDVWNLFFLIDMRSDGFVDVEEFVDGCMKVKGCPTNADIIKHHLLTRSMLREMMAEFQRAQELNCKRKSKLEE